MVAVQASGRAPCTAPHSRSCLACSLSAVVRRLVVLDRLGLYEDRILALRENREHGELVAEAEVPQRGGERPLRGEAFVPPPEPGREGGGHVDLVDWRVVAHPRITSRELSS